MRHLPLSDGTDDDFFEEFLPDPPQWNEPPRKRRKIKSQPRLAVQNTAGTDDGPTNDTIMVLDVETGESVPLEKYFFKALS